MADALTIRAKGPGRWNAIGFLRAWFRHPRTVHAAAPFRRDRTGVITPEIVPASTPVNQGLPAIANLPHHDGASAQEVGSELLRMTQPARWRLKNRVRYLLSHKPQFAIWHTQSQLIWCGLAGWPESSIPPSDAVSDLWKVDPTQFSSAMRGQDRSPANLLQLVEELLQSCGRPILLDSLVEALTQIYGPGDPQFVEGSDKTGNSTFKAPVHPTRDMACRLDQKIYLQRLWFEIRELPLHQRLALLLNMRDSSGSERLILFTQTGVTTLREIADVLNFSFEDFVGLWNRLPLDDSTISTRLGMTLQQVIHLRKSAEARLARRMRVLEG